MTQIDGLPLRVFKARNAGPFTLDGTRTYVVGRARPVIIDPGPADTSHIEALAAAVVEAEEVTIALTHRHGDHTDAVEGLVASIGARVVGTGQVGEEALADGDRIETDVGALLAIDTPGHCDAHLSFHWVEPSVLFCGDLLLGEGSTTWVAGYPTCVADYLGSLDRIEAMNLDAILPAHGPPLEDPEESISRYRDHRLLRVEQVRAAERLHPGKSLSDLVTAIYGPELPPGMRRAAEASVGAVRDYLDAEGANE